MHLSSSSGVGKKRTWDIINDDGTDVSIVNDKQQRGKQTDGSSDIAWGELGSLLALISSNDITNDTQTESESINSQSKRFA